MAPSSLAGATAGPMMGVDQSTDGDLRQRLVALVCSEPLRQRIAGIGIRYLEMAKQLAAQGCAVRLYSPASQAECESLELQPGVTAHRWRPGQLNPSIREVDVIVAQGFLANDCAHACLPIPLVIDLFDPWLVENLNYAPALGEVPFENDLASWQVQMSRGDFFLCSSQEQRTYYLGFLSALGRVNPGVYGNDPELSRLIAIAPFGIATPPAGRVGVDLLLGKRRANERRLLFGGVYDWYDPMPVLEACSEHPEWTVYLVENPNPESTPQQQMKRVRSWATSKGWLGNRVQIVGWVDFERRFDLLDEVDALVSSHHASLETTLSLRTRFLDALAAGCPIVVAKGGAVSRLIDDAGAGWVVTSDARSFESGLAQALEGPEEQRQQRLANGRRLAQRFAWEQVLGPVIAFCREPRVDSSKPVTELAPLPRRPGIGRRVVRRLRRFV